MECEMSMWIVQLDGIQKRKLRDSPRRFRLFHSVGNGCLGLLVLGFGNFIIVISLPRLTAPLHLHTLQVALHAPEDYPISAWTNEALEIAAFSCSSSPAVHGNFLPRLGPFSA